MKYWRFTVSKTPADRRKGESAIATARAQVMLYDDAGKRWLNSCGVDSVSHVQIFQHMAQQSFRVVGRSVQDRAVVLNCAISHRIRYHQATPLFHQWRDESRQVYGLNFKDANEASEFFHVMTQAIDFLARVTPTGDYQSLPVNGGEISNGVYQEPHLHANTSTPSLRDQDVDSIDSGQQPLAYRQSSKDANGPTAIAQVQRRCSQGSSGSSSLSSTGGQYGYPSQTPVANTTRPGNGQGPGGGPAPPPPPPPPPPPAALRNGNGMSLAEQMKNAQLRKTSATPGRVNGTPSEIPNGTTPARSSSASQDSGHGNLMSELTATINRRKNQIDGNGDHVDNGKAGNDNANVIVKRQSMKTNGVVNGNGNSTDSPKGHRKVPSGSSLSSQEEPSAPVKGALAAIPVASTPASTVTVDMLERWRIELLGEVRTEMARAKADIIDVLRAELNARR